MQLSTVLFDFDDTIVDSLQARVNALASVFNRAGIEADAEAFMLGLKGRQLKYALDDLEARDGRNLGLFEAYRSAYWGKAPGTLELFPGVVEMLQELQCRGFKLGIVTQKGRDVEIDGQRVGAWYEMAELGIQQIFPVMVGYEDVTRYKPDPQGIYMALDQLQSDASASIFVGDGAADVEAALAAGCWSCHAVWGIPQEERILDGVRPHAVAESPQALLDLVLTFSQEAVRHG